MTAGKAGKLAAEGVWVTLKRLRDQWVLLVFLATALFWGRDFYEKVIDLPAHVEKQGKAIDEIRVAIERLDSSGFVAIGNRSPALVFPGSDHGIEDGAPGEMVRVRLIPTNWIRKDCTATDLDAFMVDAGGGWYSVETTITRLPQLQGSQKMAFGVRVHPAMVVGRAQFVVQITQDCGSHLQVDSSPRLPFRVLASSPTR